MFSCTMGKILISDYSDDLVIKKTELNIFVLDRNIDLISYFMLYLLKLVNDILV